MLRFIHRLPITVSVKAKSNLCLESCIRVAYFQFSYTGSDFPISLTGPKKQSRATLGKTKTNYNCHPRFLKLRAVGSMLLFWPVWVVLEMFSSFCMIRQSIQKALHTSDSGTGSVRQHMRGSCGFHYTVAKS